MSSPLGKRLPSMTSPTGSGRAAMSVTPLAIAATRDASSDRRSSRAELSPFSRPASMSRPLASRISGVRATSASAIASSASFLTEVGSPPSCRDASRAARQMSVTLAAVVAMAERLEAGRLRQDEIVAVHGFLRGARQHLADLRALHPLDLPQLRCRAVADPLADQARALPDVHRVARDEPATDVHDAEGQQARAPLAQ